MSVQLRIVHCLLIQLLQGPVHRSSQQLLPGLRYPVVPRHLRIGHASRCSACNLIQTLIYTLPGSPNWDNGIRCSTCRLSTNEVNWLLALVSSTVSHSMARLEFVYILLIPLWISCCVDIGSLFWAYRVRRFPYRPSVRISFTKYRMRSCSQSD